MHLRKIQASLVNSLHILPMLWVWHTQCVFSKGEKVKASTSQVQLLHTGLIPFSNFLSSSLPHLYVKLNLGNATWDFIDLITQASVIPLVMQISTKVYCNMPPPLTITWHENVTIVRFVLFSLFVSWHHSLIKAGNETRDWQLAMTGWRP